MGSIISQRSSLNSLLLFMDQNDILRVGGRNKHSNLSHDQRHPVILSGKTHLTRLIIRAEHLKLLHAGPTLTYSSISRQCIKSVIRACAIFRRYDAKPEQQQVGQLPKERLTPGCVFSEVGVDYAGSLLIKVGPTRKPTVRKAYVCVFVCMAVKAVHLELVMELTTEAFLATLRYFTSRRGCPTDIISDHGTNFHGAAAS